MARYGFILALSLAAFVAQTNGSCSQYGNVTCTPGPYTGDPPDGKKCMSCHCYEPQPSIPQVILTANGTVITVPEDSTANNALGCCSTFFTPFTSEENCELKFNEKWCSYTLRKKDPPHKPCQINGMVG